MAYDALFYTIGAVLVGTALFTLIVALTARKIDFGDRLFKIRDRKTLVPRGPVRRKALEGIPAPSSEPKDEVEVVYDSKKAAKSKMKAKRAKPSRIESSEPVERDIVADEESDRYYEDALTGPAPGTGFAPKMEEASEELEESLKDFDDEPEMAEEAEIIDVSETIEEGHSRDLSIRLPKNMCLDEVFRLKITLIKAEEFSEDLTIKELELDKKEAEYFSLNVTKLGEKVTEATTRIVGLKEGTLIVRPIAIGNVAVVTPGQRTVFFDSEEEEIVVEFFLTPTKWSKDLISNLRIEFEQEYKVIKSVNIPVKIYKRKLEAIFGINISRWQYYALFVYSALGTISGLISFFNEKVVQWFLYLGTL